MRDFKNFFKRRYSAVSTKDVLNGPELNNFRRKSLQATRSLNINILNTFFNKRKYGSRTRSPKCAFLLLSFGVLLLTTALLVKIFQPYDMIFKWKLKFSDGGEIFNLWENPPVDLYLKIYLFNITNPDEYMSGKEKMKVEEIGPYVYKELMAHGDVVFNDNYTLSSNPKHPLVYQEHLSNGRQENDTLVMLNIALLSIAQVASEKSYFYRLPINLVIRNTRSQPLVKMTAREFMFGFESPLTTLGNTFLSDWIYFDKVGLIDRMYDFNKDYETFYTGENNVSISGLYASYMGSKHLPQWNGDHCSNIEFASDGAKFKSFAQPDEKLKFFRKSMCRPQYLIRTGNVTEVDGFNAYKYVFEENALDNGEFDERNKCYCKDGECQPRGLVDVHECYYGFPISLSYPHFMGVDPNIAENILGLEPNVSKHSSYFMIEPTSGLPLKLSVKFQINMHFKDLSSMAHVEKFSDKTIPMVWFEIAVDELPSKLRGRFNMYLNILPKIDVLGIWIPAVVGILSLLIAVMQAIMNIPNIVPSSPSSHKATALNSDKKVNFTSNVYNACEQKLFEMNEKSIMQKRRSSCKEPGSLQEQANLVNNDQCNSSNEEEDGMSKDDFNSLRRDSKYMLEDLPTMSSEEDNWNKSSELDTISSIDRTEMRNSNEQQRLIFNEEVVNDLTYNNCNFKENPSAPPLDESRECLIEGMSSLIDDIGENKFENSLLQTKEGSKNDDVLELSKKQSYKSNNDGNEDFIS